MQERKPEAAFELRLALKLRPDSEVARNNLGLAVTDDPREAILHWQSVADPATAHSNLAALLIEKGRYGDARRELDLALGYNSRHAAALNNLRLVSRLDGKPVVLPMQPAQTRRAKGRTPARKAAGG